MRLQKLAVVNRTLEKDSTRLVQVAKDRQELETVQKDVEKKLVKNQMKCFSG